MRFATTLVVPVLLAIHVHAQEAVQTWEVPDFHGQRVSEVQAFWQTEANGAVRTEVSVSGGEYHPPTRTEEGMLVQANSPDSPPGSQVEAGGTVGVILVPLERGGAPWWVTLLVGAVAGALAVVLMRNLQKTNPKV